MCLGIKDSIRGGRDRNKHDSALRCGHLGRGADGCTGTQGVKRNSGVPPSSFQTEQEVQVESEGAEASWERATSPSAWTSPDPVTSCSFFRPQVKCHFLRTCTDPHNILLSSPVALHPIMSTVGHGLRSTPSFLQQKLAYSS